MHNRAHVGSGQNIRAMLNDTFASLGIDPRVGMALVAANLGTHGVVGAASLVDQVTGPTTAFNSGEAFVNPYIQLLPIGGGVLGSLGGEVVARGIQGKPMSERDFMAKNRMPNKELLDILQTQGPDAAAAAGARSKEEAAKRYKQGAGVPHRGRANVARMAGTTLGTLAGALMALPKFEDKPVQPAQPIGPYYYG